MHRTFSSLWRTLYARHVAASARSRRPGHDRSSRSRAWRPLFAMSAVAAASGAVASRSVMTVHLSSESKEDEQKMSKRRRRFHQFAAVEFNGVEYMTPQDFLDSLILDEPRERIFRLVLDEARVQHILQRTPPLRKGSSRLFRNLGQNGLISYAEYIFMLTLITKSTHAFNIAFMMFDEDDNDRIDKAEFLKARTLISSRPAKPLDDDEEEPGESLMTDVTTPMDTFSAHRFSTMQTPPVLGRLIGVTDGQPLPKNIDDAQQDTTITLHLFGRSGRDSLSLEDFQVFYRNLQKELIEIEFQEFARGKSDITAVDFARLVLRYSVFHRDEQSPHIRRVYQRTPMLEEGITLEEFEQFSMFLNNLDDFSKAVKFFTTADMPVSKSEFIRAVRCATGYKLSKKLVDFLYRIFDTDGNDHLSYSEFIAVMNDRVHRGYKSYTNPSENMGLRAFRECLQQEYYAFSP